MYDYGLSVLEQYGLTVTASFRGRGALICETEQGTRIVREYYGSEKKLELQRRLQDRLLECGEARVDRILENQEGQLISTDRDGIPYVVREWFSMRECDVKARGDVLEGAGALARLHNAMKLPLNPAYQKESLLEECCRHNREIRKTGNYIRRKRARTDFEMELLRCMDSFLRLGEQMTEQLEKSSYKTLYQRAAAEGQLCHGECNQHNLVWTQGQLILVNYEKWSFDMQTADLYQLLRKVLEKHSWDVRLGRSMIAAYHRIRPLSEEELLDLKLRLSYPWKFWKLINYYANNHKAWISERNAQKLGLVMRQQKVWQEFLKSCFSDFLFLSNTI